MIDQIGQIGFFQMLNLVKNRVPHHFFVIDFSLPTNLQGDLKLIMAAAVLIKDKEIEEVLKSKNLAFESPIVLMCESGKLSQKTSLRLTKLGYLNIFCVKDGWRGVLNDNK